LDTADLNSAAFPDNAFHRIYCILLYFLAEALSDSDELFLYSLLPSVKRLPEPVRCNVEMDLFRTVKQAVLDHEHQQSPQKIKDC